MQIVITQKARWALARLVQGGNQEKMMVKDGQRSRANRRSMRALGLVAPLEAIIADPAHEAALGQSNGAHTFDLDKEAEDFLRLILDTVPRTPIGDIIVGDVVDQLAGDAGPAPASTPFGPTIVEDWKA